MRKSEGVIKECRVEKETKKISAKSFHEVVKAIEEYQRKVEKIESQKSSQSSSNAAVL
jgi:ribosomal protein S30